MRPTQLLRQRRTISLFRKRLGKFHHAREIGALEAATKLRNQLVRHCCNNLFSVRRPISTHHLAPNALADSPVKLGKRSIHRHGRLPASVGDQPPQVREEFLVCCERTGELVHRLCTYALSSSSLLAELSEPVPLVAQAKNVVNTGVSLRARKRTTPSLTINAGLRWNYFDSLYSKQNNLPHAVLGSGATTFTGLTLVRGDNSWVSQKGNFGPQLGFAHNPDLFKKGVVVRGGYGLNFNQFEIALTANQSNNPNNAVTPNFQGTPLVADPRIVYNLPSDLSQIFGFAANATTVTNCLPVYTTSQTSTAIFAFNDISAIGAISALRDAGFNTPEDISVLGFDDVAFASVHRPSLTTVRQPLHEMGVMAANVILEQLTRRSETDTVVRQV